MKIQGKTDIKGVEPTPVEKEPARPAAKTDAVTDRVTVEGRQVQELAGAAKQRAQVGRTARLEQLETAIRNGAYRPDASRLADQLLTAAEIDLKLRAMLTKG